MKKSTIGLVVALAAVAMWGRTVLNHRKKRRVL